MRFVIILISLCFFYVNLLASETNLASRFMKSDIVVSGRIQSISDGIQDDAGTEDFIVTISINKIYKQNIFLNPETIQVHWRVSNLVCNKIDLKDCISQYKNGTWIFILNQSNLSVSQQIKDEQILAYNNIQDSILSALQESNKLIVNHYFQHKTCARNCKLCKSIKFEKWDQVKKYLKHQARGLYPDTLIHHRRILWASSNRDILASLPSYNGTRFLFITNQREVHAYAGYQLGYIKSYLRWMPHLLYNLFRAQTYKYFSKEKIDTTILKSFLVDSNYSTQYMYYEKLNYTRMLTDTLQQSKFPPRMPLTDEYVLLTSVFDGALNFYLDYQTMPDYMERASSYINELKNKKKIYLLCLMSSHTIPEIGGQALTALKQLNDPRCIPFLIEMAKYRTSLNSKQYGDLNDYEDFNQSLIETLDALTGCKTIPQSVPYDVSSTSFEMSLSIPIWSSKIKTFDYQNHIQDIEN